ncbi:MAG TPA: Crp/Fnr family transcriptional regulator [Pyrinomonadaceae bacterium]|jgi:CRP-like cAMP-binding protein
MNDDQVPPHTIQNRILASLPAEEYERIAPHLEEVRIQLGEVIIHPDEKFDYVYFPKRGTISVCAIMEDGTQVEVGVIGNEGMCGLPILFGTDIMPLQSMVQIPDGALRMKAEVFKRVVKDCPAFYQSLMYYAQAFYVQAAQSAACNRLHAIDGRLARWLLMCQDRTQSDLLPLTHEFISIMLGVRRAGVSQAANKLKADGVIDYQRGLVRVVDRSRLEAAACECYRVVRKAFDHFHVARQ